MRTCSIKGCDGEHEAKGLCNKHYTRLRLHGGPLAGGTFKTPDGAILAWITENKNYDGDDCLIWPFALNSKGYGSLWVDGVWYVASRFMCEQVNGPPPSPKHDAAHSCGKGHLGCTSPKHLSWKTKLANSADRLTHGTLARGSKLPQAKLTEADVLAIRQIRGISQRDIGERFGVNKATVSNIQTRTTWAWLEPPNFSEEKPNE